MRTVRIRCRWSPLSGAWNHGDCPLGQGANSSSSGLDDRPPLFPRIEVRHIGVALQDRTCHLHLLPHVRDDVAVHADQGLQNPQQPTATRWRRSPRARSAATSTGMKSGGLRSSSRSAISSTVSASHSLPRVPVLSVLPWIVGPHVRFLPQYRLHVGDDFCELGVGQCARIEHGTSPGLW